MAQYKTGWAKLPNLVPQHIYNQYHDKAWEFLDDRLLITLDRLWNIYGPMTINNWDKGGDRHWECLRTDKCPYYNFKSQHTFGRAANILFENWNHQEILSDIMQHREHKEFEFINAVMIDVEWVHIDVRNANRLKIVESINTV